MNETPSAASESLFESAAKRTRTLDWERLGFLYARIALGAAFLSGSPTVSIRVEIDRVGGHKIRCSD